MRKRYYRRGHAPGALLALKNAWFRGDNLLSGYAHSKAVCTMFREQPAGSLLALRNVKKQHRLISVSDVAVGRRYGR